MAASSRIAQQSLSAGRTTAVATIPFLGEIAAFNFVVTQVGSSPSQARLVITDSNSSVLKTASIDGTDTQRVLIESSLLSAASSMRAYIECSLGTCLVSLVELTGAEGVLPGTGTAIDADDIPDSAITTAKLADGALANSAAGRGKMADGFLSADAAGLAKMADGFLAASAGGRAKMADSFFNDTTTVSAKFAAASIPANRVVASAPDITNAIADPGDGQAIPVTTSGYVALVSAGAETRTLAIPAVIGEMLLLFLDTDMGNVVVTVASAFDGTGNNTLTFDDAGDTILLVGISIGGTRAWRVVENVGVGASMV